MTFQTVHEEKKTGQARVGRAHRVFRKKIGFELFIKFKFSLARALSSEILLELAALIPNFAPLLRLLFLLFNHIFPKLVYCL